MILHCPNITSNIMTLKGHLLAFISLYIITNRLIKNLLQYKKPRITTTIKAKLQKRISTPVECRINQTIH